MSVENLTKELDIIHNKIRNESDLASKVSLMSERDQIMRELSKAYNNEAAYYHKKAQELEEASRPKTVQMPTAR